MVAPTPVGGGELEGVDRVPKRVPVMIERGPAARRMMGAMLSERECWREKA
jgi:hypothetical protein